MKGAQLLLLVVVIIVVVYVVYMCAYTSKGKREGYSGLSPSSVAHIGSVDSGYEKVNAPELDAPSTAPYTMDYADLVPGNAHAKIVQPPNVNESMRPTERLHRTQGSSMLPRDSSEVTPYNVDVADQAIYSFSVNAPRVQTKTQLYADNATYLATAIRGDIPITYHADIPLIGRSQYGRDLSLIHI